MPTTCSKQGKLWKWNEFAALENMAFPVRVKVKRYGCFGKYCFWSETTLMLGEYGLGIETRLMLWNSRLMLWRIRKWKNLIPEFLILSHDLVLFIFKETFFFYMFGRGLYSSSCKFPLSFELLVFKSFVFFSNKVHLGACFVDFDEGVRIKQNE